MKKPDAKAITKVKTKDKKTRAHSRDLNQIPFQTGGNLPVPMENVDEIDKTRAQSSDNQSESSIKADDAYSKLFEQWDETEFNPQDFWTDVPVDSLESAVGYSSLLRQMHQSFIRMVAFHTSSAGGSYSVEEARRKAFHACDSAEEAKKVFSEMMRLPVECLNFADLETLQSSAPRVAEKLWERIKKEGRAEFESGHLGANISFPTGYMKQLWNIAKYLGVRESFIDEWKPKAGIEVALIDMLAQSYFQWQYWLEQTVKRSQTKERNEHPEYVQWKKMKGETEGKDWDNGNWTRPLASEQQAVESAVQMVDRFNRIFMRTLRQLRDLRRYSPLTINNSSQVNIAANGGQQINVSNENLDNAPQ